VPTELGVICEEGSDCELADLSIMEEGEEGEGEGETEKGGVLGQCGKGLMTMGFAVPLGGDAADDGESCLDIFYGYVRRGDSNEVLRAVRRWALGE
jgi:hypothetical protein